jgi:hypothetical protein
MFVPNHITLLVTYVCVGFLNNAAYLERQVGLTSMFSYYGYTSPYLMYNHYSIPVRIIITVLVASYSDSYALLNY